MYNALKLLKKSFNYIAVFFLLLTLTNCNIGLGTIVDIEAPEISVARMVTEGSEKIKFDITHYTRKNVTFYGNAKDNDNVERVYVEIKWLNDADYHFLSDARLDGDRWVVDINFDQEGACWLKFIAEDRKKNNSSNSYKIITLFVDDKAPEIGEPWYIDRGINGIRYSLQERDELLRILSEDSNLVNPVNKDVAQNGTFYICGSLKDASGIADENLSISLYNSQNELVKGNIPIDLEETTSNYAPKFKIDGTGLTESGYHLYQVRYSAKDLVEDPAPNVAEDQPFVMGWFLWWPESDNPKFSVTDLKKGSSTMNIHTGDSLSITVFDDDALKGDIECVLTGKENVREKKTIESDTERDCNIILKAPDTPQTMTLTVSAKDINGKSVSANLITVYVANDSKPSLILIGPENNQIPAVTGADGNIHFSGVTLDEVECNHLEFVWVPDAVANTLDEKKRKAESALTIINGDLAKYIPTGSEKFKKTIMDDGCVVWSAKLTEDGKEGSFKKYNIDFDISLMNDFGSEKNSDKYILARLSRGDDDNTHSDTELKLIADNLKPEIEPVHPAGNMAFIDQDADLQIRFRGKKDNGLQMNTSKYKVTYYYDKENKDNKKILNGVYDSVQNLYICEKITADELKSLSDKSYNPEFDFEIEDILGNTNTAKYQFFISSIPWLNSVTSTAPGKCKAGDVIYINASFSKPLTCTSATYIKLKGIKNIDKSISVDDIIPAYYSSGSGSTSLVFKYIVQPGDSSNGLLVYNERGVGPIVGLEDSAHLDRMDDSNNLQAKRSGNPITIDGVAPKVLSVNVTTSGIGSNIVDGVTYLKAGRIITATLKTDKAVTVQGTPEFLLQNGADTLTLSWQSISQDGKTLVFSKKISSSDKNTRYSYSKSAYLGVTNKVIKDTFGNELVKNNISGFEDTKVVVDTEKPGKPTIKIVKRTEGDRYKDSVKFTIDTPETSGVNIYYSTDGGSKWITYNSDDVVVLTKDAALVSKVMDYAGNTSDYSDVINLEVRSSFPDFTVECVNPSGNYKSGTVLEFKVNFERAVDIDSNSNAYFNLSAESGTITPGAKAVITPASKRKNVTEAVFEYTTKDTDDFTLQVLKDAFVLNGIKDKYGIEQGSKSLNEDYIRDDLKCDSIAPTVVSMTPQGTKSTQNDLNAYTNAKQIKLTFNEPVNVVSGKIYLRQTSGWAIPPMFTATEFNKVLAAVNGITVTENGKTLTGSQVLYMDGLEDAENLYGALVGPANDRYHGTAQYVGPYKKMTNGIDGSGNPDLSVKYVLDFGVDIWDKNNSTKQNFGKTFEPNWSRDGKTYTYMDYHKENQEGWVHVITPETVITTDTIRSVLEKAHFHERYMNVNSTYVEVSEDRKTYTLNFPEGVLGESDLPLGRQWELVIEKNAFMDDTGNYFGEDSEEKLILIQEGSGDTKRDSFMSAGVEKPVIRVNRYSYGLGIKQPTAVTGNTVSEEQIEILNTTGASWRAGTGLTKPSAQVAVKIDCESRAATVRYAMNSEKSSGSSTLTINRDQTCQSYTSETTTTIPDDAVTGTKTGRATTKIVLLAGSGNYKESCKAYITADAISEGAKDSEVAKEGVFQTVVEFNKPRRDGYWKNNRWVNGDNGTTEGIWNAGDGIQAVNIHGTTGSGGVPSISPFPLRDQPVSSAYMRQTYQNGTNYYWVSYEILTPAIFSMYAYGRCGAGKIYNNPTDMWYDWSPGYGQMEVGEFIRCDNMLSYTCTTYR